MRPDSSRRCASWLRLRVRHPLGVSLHVIEPDQMIVKPQLDGARRAVPLLREDRLGRATVVIGRRVLLFAMDEDHDVGILFDGTGVTEIREDWPMVAAFFRIA